MQPKNYSATDVLEFWFDELKPKQWWLVDKELDALIANRFTALHRQAAACELFHWRATPEGRLAEIIVLDQFSRNIYRNTPRAFGQDPLALSLAQQAVAQNTMAQLLPRQAPFLLMPYMHSESAVIHTHALNLFQQLGSADNVKFELRHKAIIDRFGRYPHRNKILGRESTEEEREFLQQPGSSF